MRKRLRQFIAGTLLLAVSISPVLNSNAKESDGYSSDLLAKDEAVGELTNSTRGQYLMSGATVITNLGNGNIAAAGDTTAHTSVNVIQLAVIVEQYNNGSWYQVYSWRVTDYNTFYISSEKTMSVPRGYYYRARGIHSANSDVGNSYTDGIWIG